MRSSLDVCKLCTSARPRILLQAGVEDLISLYRSFLSTIPSPGPMRGQAVRLCHNRCHTVRNIAFSFGSYSRTRNKANYIATNNCGIGGSYPKLHDSPVSGPPMPMPVPYTPSASAPALTRPSYTSNRRNSNPTPQRT
jgi:hypothetical protein